MHQEKIFTFTANVLDSIRCSSHENKKIGVAQKAICGWFKHSTHSQISVSFHIFNLFLIFQVVKILWKNLCQRNRACILQRKTIKRFVMTLLFSLNSFDIFMAVNSH